MDDNVRLLPISNSLDCAIVDDFNYPLLKQFTWCYKKSGSGAYYVVTGIRDGRRVYIIRLHRLIMLVWDKNLDVHHKDGNILNCLENNLEIQESLKHRCSHLHTRNI